MSEPAYVRRWMNKRVRIWRGGREDEGIVTDVSQKVVEHERVTNLTVLLDSGFLAPGVEIRDAVLLP